MQMIKQKLMRKQRLVNEACFSQGMLTDERGELKRSRREQSL